MSVLRKIRFYLYKASNPYAYLHFVESVLLSVYARLSRPCFYGPIAIIPLGSDQRYKSLQWVKSALKLIEENDPRRFRRVQNTIKFILIRRGIGMGSYSRAGKICGIDLSRLERFDDNPFVVQLAACTLVHEATHGLIESRYIPHFQKRMDRIEELCAAEERRFMKRFPDAYKAFEVLMAMRVKAIKSGAEQAPTMRSLHSLY